MTVTINGISFLKQTGGDATAGHVNTWTAYSTVRDNVCVSLDFVLRAANLGNFPTPPSAFDEAAETAVFGQIVATYTWLALSPTVTPTATALPTGMIIGQVISSKPATISVYDVNNVLIASAPVALDGRSFAITLPGGIYTVTARASGFLSAQGSFTVVSNMNLTLPTITLPAGDIDGNSVIDQFDAMTIGMSYNTTVPAAADLNSDGSINVLDLELLAGNYRKSGALVW